MAVARPRGLGRADDAVVYEDDVKAKGGGIRRIIEELDGTYDTARKDLGRGARAEPRLGPWRREPMTLTPRRFRYRR